MPAAKGWIEVSDLYCKGCELCISACPPQVMELDMSRLTPKGYHPAHTFKDGCTGCTICALVCPDAAITVGGRNVGAVAPAGLRSSFSKLILRALRSFAVRHGDINDT